MASERRRQSMAISTIMDRLPAGITGGALAGVLLLLGESATAVALGAPVEAPMRSPALVLAGEGVLSAAVPWWRAVWPGLLVHLSVSILLGLLFIALFTTLPRQLRHSWSPLTIGLAVGLVYWGLNLAFLSPWVSTGQPLLQIAEHSLLYGLPLALYVPRALSPSH